MLSAPQNIYYPELYSLDLDSNELERHLDGYNNVYVNQMSALQLSSIEDPVFTYNSLKKQYNIAFVGHSPLYNGMIVTTINVKDLNERSEINSVVSITPVSL